jgi:DNA-binding HxlR family transcriptional regulator
MRRSLRRQFSCPVELALEVLGGKWKTVILAHLKQAPLRYGELRARVPALSDKVLGQRLRELEGSGLVVRHKKGGRGAPSRYELSARGRSLAPVLQGLHDWGERVSGEVGATVVLAAGRRWRDLQRTRRCVVGVEARAQAPSRISKEL